MQLLCMMYLDMSPLVYIKVCISLLFQLYSDDEKVVVEITSKSNNQLYQQVGILVGTGDYFGECNPITV